MDEDTSVSAEIAAYRAVVLESSDQSVKASLERLVVDGIQQGLVVLEDETGLAVARTLLPVPKALPPGTGWEERRAWVADPYFEQTRKVKDLSYALGCPEVQETALRALGAPVIEIGVFERMLAMDLLAWLAPMASGRAPASAIKHTKHVLAAHADAVEGGTIWHAALVNVLRLVQRVARPREQVQWVLDVLRASVTALPRGFLEPTETQLQEADRVMTKLRSRRTGHPFSPWGAAKLFAAAFGIKLPARLRDSRRRKAARGLVPP